MKFVIVPAGAFDMGSPPGDEEAEENEKPQRRIRLTRPFHLGVHEVTMGQFRAFVEATGYLTDAEKEKEGATGYRSGEYVDHPDPLFNWKYTGWLQEVDHPVVNVSWNDAKAFCAWLSKKENVTYRLPTEAEWEYACRAGTKTRFWTGEGNNSLKDAENIGDFSLLQRWRGAPKPRDWNDGFPFSAPVGSFKPNPWGLFDIHGNVSELTEDWYFEEAYRDALGDDPKGPESGSYRVTRGGSWYNEPHHVRSAFRWGQNTPDHRDAALGFRVVRQAGD
jgi:formylglycine-generating enzyme required for sulfatase activity